MNGLGAWLHTCDAQGSCSHVLTPGLTGTSDSDYNFQPVNLDSVDFLLEQSYALLGITAGKCSDVINHSDEAIRCACKVEHRNLHQLRPFSAPSIPSRPDIPYDLTIFGRKIDLRLSRTGPCAVCGSGRADDDDVMFRQCRRQLACKPAASNVDGGPSRRLSSTAGDSHERCQCSAETNSSDFAERVLNSTITSSHIGRNRCAVGRCRYDCNGRNPVAEIDYHNTSIECGTAEEICDASKPGNRSTSLRVDPPSAVGNPSLHLTLRKFDEIRRESQIAKERIYGRFESRARLRIDSLLKSFHVQSPTENGDTVTRGNNKDSSATLTSTSTQSGSLKTASLSAPTSKPIVAVKDRERENPHALTLKARPAPASQLSPRRRVNDDSKRSRLKTHHDFDQYGTPLDEFVSGVNVKNTTSLRFSAVSDVDNGAETICEKVPFDSGCTSQFSERCVANGNGSLLNYSGSPSTLRGLSITELLTNFDHIRLAGLKARRQNCYDYQQQRKRRLAGRKQPPISTEITPIQHSSILITDLSDVFKGLGL